MLQKANGIAMGSRTSRRLGDRRAEQSELLDVATVPLGQAPYLKRPYSHKMMAVKPFGSLKYIFYHSASG